MLKQMFKFVEQMGKERKEVPGAKYVKDERQHNFETLLNENKEHEFEEIDMVQGPIEEISEEEVNRALNGMKSGKAPGPTGLSSDLMKKAGFIGELMKTFRDISENGGKLHYFS